MPDRPSILIIVIDALRADCTPSAAASAHLRAVGLKPPNLPTLAGVVHGAAAFTQAFACSSYTTACHASLFTGLLPPEHGVRAFSVTSLSRDVRTLAEILVDAGYVSCAMSDQPIFFQPEGLLRGFQTMTASEDEALAWWDSYQEMPRLLFMHLWDIHQPYGMPVGRAYRGVYPAVVDQWKARLRKRNLPIPQAQETYYEDADRFQVGLMQQLWQDDQGFKAGLEDYIAGLQTFDRGRLASLSAALAARRIPEDAILIVTADHGEGRDIPPSPRVRHGNSLLDDQIHIPLFIRLPHAQTPSRIERQVSQADITPTILDAVGLLAGRSAPRSPHSGQSMLPLLRGQGMSESLIYAETSTIYRDPVEAAQGPLEPIPDPQHPRTGMIRYRMLRQPERKYWLVGRPDAISDEMLGGSADDVFRVFFRDVLGRPETLAERNEWLPLLRATAPSDLGARRVLLQRFERSGEFQRLPKFAICDLVRDPLEMNPSDARQKPADWADYEPKLQAILELDRVARPGEPLVSNEADEEVVLKRLQGLGYVE